jgi:hypothetical protein
MVTEELLNFIRFKKQSEVDDESIRQTLLENGWDLSDIDSALAGHISSETKVNSVPSPISHEQASAEIKRMGRFRASKMLFTQSLNLLKKDKEIVLFPIVASIASFILLVLFGLGTWLLGVYEIVMDREVIINDTALFYSALFIFYVCSFFFLTYFRVGLTAVVYERINGGDIDFKEGISRASKISGKIFVWSLLSATVGIVLRIISDRSKLLGKLVASLLGAAWGIVTFFIAPTLLLDNVSVWQSVKNSGNVFKKTWGETIILNVSLGFVMFLFILATLAFYGLLTFLVLTSGAMAWLFVIIPLFFLTLIILSIISSCLSEIFKVALYSYARFGIIAEGFSPELIVGAVKEAGSLKK